MIDARDNKFAHHGDAHSTHTTHRQTCCDVPNVVRTCVVYEASGYQNYIFNERSPHSGALHLVFSSLSEFLIGQRVF